MTILDENKKVVGYNANGHNFRLIERVGDWAVFRGYRDTIPTSNYELIKLRKRKADKFLNNIKIVTKGDEYIPTNDEWGSYGYTIPFNRIFEALREQSAQNV